MPFEIDRRRFLLLSSAVAAGAVVGLGSRSARAAVLPGSSGYLSNDLDPRSSSLGAFGQPTRLALDYSSRSVGRDLLAPARVTAIEIVTETAANRLGGRDFSVYTSADNATWQRIDAELVVLEGSLWFYGFDAVTRYIKVHCHREDTSTWTCAINNMQNDVRAHLLGANEFVGANGGVWTYRTPVTVTNTGSTIARDRAAYVTFAQLGTAALIAAGKLAADMRDLRFADSSGHELHAYADAAGVFVRVPQLAGGASTTLYAYSGNPSARKRIDRDSAALQVQYGRRAITSVATETSRDSVKVARLPGGKMLMAFTGNATERMTAKYSANGGRTWSALTPMLAPLGLPGEISEGPSGFLWDPGRSRLTCFFQVNTSSQSGDDYTDPTQRNVQNYVVQADTFNPDGSPVWGTPRHVPLVRQTDGVAVAWGLSYTNPILTTSGAYLHAISYITRPDGTFVSNVIRSTDGGLTWTQSPDELALAQVGFEKGLTEPGLVQRADGTVLLYARQQLAQKHYLAMSTSSDDGVNWSAISDSPIMASNTQSTLLRSADDALVLTWSGHNAFSQTSYYRNNLTAAYSLDDGGTWLGHEDLLAATSRSAPGWKDGFDQRQVQNSDSAPIDATDRLFAWVTPSVHPMKTTSMVVEDFERMVRDSHGALDTPHHLATARAAQGSELADWRWWRTSRRGTLALVAGQRTGRNAVQLAGVTGYSATASRLFPTIRSGRVRFAMRVNAFGAGLRFALQEAYSNTTNAPGGVVSLLISPTGVVEAVGPDTFLVTHDIGHTNANSNPATGQLIALGQYGNVAMDFQNRSIGADLYSARPVTTIEVINDPLIGQATTRVDEARLTVWRSSDNATWTQVAVSSRSKVGDVITLTVPTFTDRYVKVAHPYTDALWGLGNERQRLLRVSPAAGTAPVLAPLSVPTTLALNTWHLVDIGVDIANDTVSVTVDGQLRATLPAQHPATGVSHLLLAVVAGSQAASVSIDEFMVQDVSAPLPSVTAVGATAPI